MLRRCLPRWRRQRSQPRRWSRPRLASRLGVAVVHGRSMQPTLRDGDRLLVWHDPDRTRLRGRLVVVRLPDAARTVAVKRAVHREAGGWWVERDNPAAGVDSWSVGAVPDGDVIARVLCRLPRRARGTGA